MLFVQVKSSNAFFEGQQGLVDFCAIYLRLLVRVHCVCTTLATCQIYEANLTVQSAIVFENHLHDGVRTGTFCIGTGGSARSERHANVES